MRVECMSSWQQFREAVPGQRFIEYHGRATHSPVLSIVFGSILIVAGLVMLVAPGPGLLALALGFASLASGSRWFAERLDRAELRVRAWRHRRDA